MNQLKIIKFYFLLVLINFWGCAKKSTSPKINFGEFPIHLEMTKNLTVFENLGPALYKSLYEQLKRAGYTVIDDKEEGYFLRTKIESLNDSSARLISLDVVPFLFRVELVIKCQLYDHEEKLILEKDFKFFKWFSRPSDALLDSNFLSYQYEELINRSVIKIDQFFKIFFIKRKTNGLKSSSDKI